MLTVYSFPGNVDDEDYVLNCPAPRPMQVMVVGIVGRTIQPKFEKEDWLRMFELKLSVYKSKEEKSAPLTLMCMFPSTRRWRSTRLPSRGSLVSVAGEISGIHDETKSVAVLIQSFDYINARGTEMATQSSQMSSPTPLLGGATPKKNKWSAYSERSQPEKSNKLHRTTTEDVFTDISSSPLKGKQVNRRGNVGSPEQRLSGSPTATADESLNWSLTDLTTREYSEGNEI